MKPINLLVGGLTLFTAQGCKAPKQVVERSEPVSYTHLTLPTIA